MSTVVNALLSPVADLMLLVGEHIRRSLSSRLHITGTDGSVVTNVDLDADLMIRRGLEGLTPDLTILTEEAEPRDTGSKQHWVVDPVDGTQNLAIGLPLVGASVALLDENDRCLLAVAADPVGGRVLVADATTLYSRSWLDGTPRPVAAGNLPAPAGIRRVGLLRGNTLARDDAEFTRLNEVLTRSVSRVLQTRSPIVDVFLLFGGGLDALVCLGCDGYEMPAVVHLARRMGFDLVPGPIDGPEAWGHPFSYTLCHPANQDGLNEIIGWAA
ncbi:inositol monophosphatase family protein [Actinoplanes solisilvae]|uniref:inositol monophosphatase family protein n=1 Tax=Actinoplanes solisilvae TaxID=2486853 RepID=UPI000FDA1FEA|nr:inositol monophosphatase family protein [Actinoplanes solisilvae]